MNQSSLSLLVFGIYLALLGAALVVIPNVVLVPLGLPATNELWIHIVGVLTLALAFYFLQAARTRQRAFAVWTVQVRAGVFVCFAVFVLIGWASPVLILLGAVDLIGAIWTGWALAAEKKPS